MVTDRLRRAPDRYERIEMALTADEREKDSQAPVGRRDQPQRSCDQAGARSSGLSWIAQPLPSGSLKKMNEL